MYNTFFLQFPTIFSIFISIGGIEVRTYGVGFRTGQFKYECNSIKCSNTEEGNDGDDVLVIERSTHTIRAVEPRTGSER